MIIIRRDLNMRRGKEIAQGAHASMMWLTERLEPNRHYDSSGEGGAYLEGDFTEAERLWVTGNFRKITCQVPSEEALRELMRAAEEASVMAHLVIDAGLTEFGGQPTATAVAVGPDWDWRVDKVTAGLKLY